MIEQLAASPIFKGVSMNELENIFKETHYQLKKYALGDCVAMQHDPCNSLMIVIEGQVQGQMMNDAGKLIIIEQKKAPFPIATAFLYATENFIPVDIICKSDNTNILFIPKEEFLKIMQHHPTIMTNFMRIISNQSKFLSDKIGFLNLKNIKHKIAQFLLQKSKESNSLTIELHQTKEELAAYFGVTRPALVRMLGEMEKDGLIVSQRKAIIIVDPKSLV